MIKQALLLLISAFILLYYYFHNQNNIIVHIIAHSHDDVGWLKTPQEYYYGMRQDIQRACVKDTITTVYEELIQDPTKKFIQVEIAFFRWWFEDQTQDVQQKTKNLIKDKQLVFTNAGASMNDESSPYYEDIIDNMSWGHQFILKNFGEEALPTIGWQIDPFGHSQAQASLFNQMGFNGWFFARIDYQDRNKRDNQKTLEFITNTPNNNSIFTHVLYHHYSCPNGFNFDILSNDQQITDQNINQKSIDLVNYFKDQSKAFNSSVIMHTFGDDFNFANATKNFANLDKLIKYINSNFDGIKLKYSTPDLYLKELNQLKKEFTVKQDDFFPYADGPDAYWTGYFTSRPSSKYFGKVAGRFLQITRNLISLLIKNNEINQDQKQSYIKNLDDLEFNLGIFQHHDAIAGTAKQAVADNYIQLMIQPLNYVKDNLNEIFQNVNQKNGQINKDYQICNLNGSIYDCQPILNNIKYNQDIYLNIYNPGVANLFNLRVKVPQNNFQVYSESQSEILTDIICLDDYCDLYFQAKLDSMKVHNYIIKKIDGNLNNIINKQNLDNKNYQLIDNQILSFQLNNQSRKFKISKDNQTNQFELQYGYYISYDGDGQHSGAYIFRTEGESLDGFINYGFNDSLNDHYIFIGKLVTIVQMKSQQVQSQVKFFYSNDEIEIETFLDSIDISDNKGKEIVISITTQIQNDNKFVTDSNGMYFQDRKLNYRPSWDFESTQFVPQNYYPVNAVIGIEDSINSLFVLNDRSQGGSSLKPGQIELMMNRRILQDDGRGVGENLNEVDKDGAGIKLNLQHYLLFQSRDNARKLQYKLDLQPLVIMSSVEKQQNLIFNIDQKLKKLVNGQNNQDITINNLVELQEGLKFYLKYIDTNKYILRFHNMLENQNISLNLDNLNVKEVQLTGVKDQQKTISEKLVWNNLKIDFQESYNLLPQQIKTFILDFNNINPEI